MDSIVSITRAAGMLNCSTQSLRDAIARGDLAAEKCGQMWLIDAADFATYTETYRKYARRPKVDR